MLCDVCANCHWCVVLRPPPHTPPFKKNRTELGDRDSSPRQLDLTLFSGRLGTAPEIISLYSLGDLCRRLPSFDTSVRGRLRHELFSVRCELIAYVLYGLIPINVVIITNIAIIQGYS